MNYIYIIVAILGGIVFALQPAINENVARSLNHPLQASLISFFVGTVLLIVINVLLRIELPSTEQLLAIPQWMWLSGGAIGSFVVTAAIVVQPKIGAGVWVACYVSGQLTTSILMDNYGWFGLEVHPINIMRSLGVFFLAVGTILIARY